MLISFTRALTAICLASITIVAHAFAGDAEPQYYIYRGQPKQLSLDGEHVAVHVRNNTADHVPAGLASHGFSDADIEARPLDDWMVLRTHGTGGALTNSVPGVSSPPRTDAVTVHNLVRSLTATGDPTVDFVSPVFHDPRGQPVLVTSRLLIGFGNDLSAAARLHLQAGIPEGAFTEQTAFPRPNDQNWQIHTADGFTLLARANALAQTPGVTYAEPDMIMIGHHDLTPNDPNFYLSWGLHNTGFSGGTPGFDLNVTPGWDITTGSPAIIVVIFDSGIQQDHPDINQIPGRDFTSDANINPSGGPVGSNDNHGTWVAGCVSERINNSLGTTGAAPGCKVASARVGTKYQTNGTFTFQPSWLVNALSWAQSIGGRVTNNSNSYGEPSSAIDAAYSSAHANGMVHFAAAGNDASVVIDYPSSSPDVNSVASVSRYGILSGFSNHGPGLKFAAPGEEIFTTDRTGRTSEPGDYATVSGTSFASPYTAAIAALVFSVHPDWTAAQVEQQLQITCRDLGTPGYDTGYGYGMPDAYKAVTFVKPPPTPTPTPTPTISPTPTATATPLPTPTPTPTVTPPVSPTPTPEPTPSLFPPPTNNPQPINPNDVLISAGIAIGPSSQDQNIVREFTIDGVPVQTIAFRYNNGAYPDTTDYLRAIVIDSNGSIAAFNGTSHPLLTRFSTQTKAFTDISFDGWDTSSDQRFAGIASFQQFVYVTDMDMDGSGRNGIVRFDTATSTATRFASGNDFIDVTMGLDGRLYGLTIDKEVLAYDPLTMELLRDVVLPPFLLNDSLVALAVDQIGTLYIGETGRVWRFNQDGAPEYPLDFVPFSRVRDIAVDELGHLVGVTEEGYLVLGDTISGWKSAPWAVGDTSLSRQWPIFVTFGRHLVPPPPTPTPTPTATPVPTPTPVPTATPIPRVINPADILISLGVPTDTDSPNQNSVQEFDLNGNLVQKIFFRYNNGPYTGSEYLRDIVVNDQGLIYAVNGTAGPTFTSFAVPSRFSDHSAPNWLIADSPTRGGIGAYQNYLFAADDEIGANGIIRFNTTTNNAERFADGVAILDVNVGVDGKVYALTPPTVRVYDPITLQLLREISLPLGAQLRARGIAADRLGRVFLCGEAEVWRLNADGSPDIDLYFGLWNLTDIDIDENDHVIMANDVGIVYMGLTTLQGFVSLTGAFEPGVERHWPIFVAFGHSVHTPGGSPTPTPSPTPIGTPGPPPTITVFASPGSVVEGGTAQFIISASPVNPSGPTVVNFSITGRAVAGLDYTVDGNPTQVTIPANTSSAMVTLHALTDTIHEKGEKVTLTLFQAPGYNLSRLKAARKATVTILNLGGSRR